MPSLALISPLMDASVDSSPWYLVNNCETESTVVLGADSPSQVFDREVVCEYLSVSSYVLHSIPVVYFAEGVLPSCFSSRRHMLKRLVLMVIRNISEQSPSQWVLPRSRSFFKLQSSTKS
jgi:hypothetical protein